MSNWFNLSLDTTPPSSPTIIIENGNTYATNQLINVSINVSDVDKTGYTMKFWGDVDPSFDSNIQTLESSSSWITYNASKQIKLSSGDGNKNIYCKIRDDVYNVSSQVSDSIIMDSTLPVVSVSGGDIPKISKILGKNICSFSFQSDSAFDEYIVKVVASSANTHDTGIQISNVNGSVNMYGNVGNYPANTPINCQISGADLEAASVGDGIKIVKVFVKEKGTGLWSV